MGKTIRPVAITGVGWELPGADPEFIWNLTPDYLAPDEFDAKAKLGKGLRYKDQATLLALSAAKNALLHAGLPVTADTQSDKPDFGVVVSSNLGNLDTVANVISQIRKAHVDATSAMDLPNASSNVVPAAVAIRYGLQGMNLMVCNGASSGLDAVHLAANCIRAGRAQHMLVVGVEVDNTAVRRFLGTREYALFNGAVAVVLESMASLQQRDRPSLGYLGEYHYWPDVAAVASLPGSSCYFACREHADMVPKGQPTIDVSNYVGESYGAEGLVQLVTALQLFSQKEHMQALLIGGGKVGDRGIAALEARVAL